jgi:HTH-type transcriptional regulator/antitoxin HigA
MSKIRVIRTEKDYAEALKLLERLMASDPESDSDESEQLELLATLIEDYESKTFPETMPDPIEAIKFRMEQQNLKAADLIPYIGSSSRVSEILSGKRQLTLEMVRALETGLGIPAKVLIQKSDKEETRYQNWSTRLFKEMGERGYFDTPNWQSSDKARLLKKFFDTAQTQNQLTVMLRQSSYRSSPLTDKSALAAWSTFVVREAEGAKPLPKFKEGSVSLEFMQNLAKLSKENGDPLLVQTYLKKHGIILVIEPHFSKTYLDGATILENKDNPVIGLTLRYDRLDNFWFTLMHELAHISLHSSQNISLFYDELEGVKGTNIGSKEQEADDLAHEALVPRSKWENSPAKIVPSAMAAQSLANELGVHLAIVAGAMRYAHKNYTYLSEIVNAYPVRKYFSSVKWSK